MAATECPACGSLTTGKECCGVALNLPFRMTRNRVLALRRYAHGRKGLDEATYRLNLRAVGVDSTLSLTRDQHNALLKRLGALPDAPKRANA